MIDVKITPPKCGVMIAPATVKATLDSPAVIRNPIERDPYEGAYIVAPSYDNDIVLPTNGLRMTDDVTVNQMIWNWIGKDATKIATYAKTTVALKDTSFNGWTPATTAKAIKSGATAGTFTGDFANYEYMIRWRWRFDAAYNEGATLKNQTYRECAEIWQILTRRAGSLATLNASNANTNSCVTLYIAPLHVYYGNTANSLTFTHSVAYGVYPSATAATFASTTNNSTTVTVKTPAANARCNATQFATARASELDQTNSKYSYYGEVYRVKRKSAMQEMTDSLYDIYNNGV